MGLCCSCEADENSRRPFLGIKRYEDRECTDVIFLLAYVALWVAILALMGSALDAGAHPRRLVRGVDLNGDICGHDDAVKDLPYLSWPDYLDFDVRVCVNNCSATETSSQFSPNYVSSKFLWYCVPTSLPGVNLSVDISLGGGDLESAADSAAWAVGDVSTTWKVLLASIFLSVLLSFFFLVIVQRVGGCLVFFAIFAIFSAGLVASFALLWGGYEARSESGASSSRAQGMMGLGWVVVILTVLFLIIVFAMRKRIEIALEVISEASESILEVQAVFFPLLPFIFVGLFIAFWVFVAMCLFSVTKETSRPLSPDLQVSLQQQNYTHSDFETQWNGSYAVHVFFLLWTIQNVIYFSFIVIAGAIANWYFTPAVDGHRRRGDADNELPEWPILQSCKRTCRFHLGTVSFGALIISIVVFIRWVIRYLDSKSRVGAPNKLQQCIAVIIDCCLRCIQCCLDKINKNALIWTAIWGDSLIPASCNSFSLLWSNVLRLAALSMVGSYLLIIGKLFVSFMTTGIYLFIIWRAYYKEGEISALTLPAAVCFLMSYTVASLFMEVVDTAIDTVFLCFLVDEQHNAGTGQMFAPESLRNLVIRHADASKEMGEKLTNGRNVPGGRVYPSPVAPPSAIESQGSPRVAWN